MLQLNQLSWLVMMPSRMHAGEAGKGSDGIKDGLSEVQKKMLAFMSEPHHNGGAF
jgi:hypothetical protein